MLLNPTNVTITIDCPGAEGGATGIMLSALWELYETDQPTYSVHRLIGYPCFS